MLRRLWNLLFSKIPSRVATPSNGVEVVDCGPGLADAVDEEIHQPTGLDHVSVDQLMSRCDAYWANPAEPNRGTPEEQVLSTFTDEVRLRYRDYVDAINELSTRGPEIADWAIAHLSHQDYSAREQAAFIVGQLAGRDQLNTRRQAAVTGLCALAVRSVVEDRKELQANSAAVAALVSFRDHQTIATLRHIVQSWEWRGDELQREAALTLGELVGQPFNKSDSPVADALQWIETSDDR